MLNFIKLSVIVREIVTLGAVMTKKWLILIFFAIIFLNRGLGCSAQQTIINVPNDDVLPLGDMIFKESNRFSPFYPDGYATITPSTTFGTGRGTEISTGIATTLDGNTVVRGDISAKKVWFLGHSTRITTGATISPYLSQADRPNTFVFAHFSHRIKETKTSLTAGGYIGGHNSFPNDGGVLFGLEQVLIPNKLRLAFDWMSGHNSNGRMGVGLKYRPVPTLSITSAVILANNDEENVSFNISISKFISLKNNTVAKRRL